MEARRYIKATHKKVWRSGDSKSSSTILIEASESFGHTRVFAKEVI